jgi:membrane protease YdiL (CAAX protease family)
MTSHAFQTAGSVGAASTPTGASPNRPTIARPDVTADPRPVQQPVRGAGIALGLVVVIVLAEYVARRVVAPWLPIVGAPIANDMLTMAVCYALLVAVAVGNAARTPVALGRALWAVVSRARGWLAWIGGVVFLTATLVVMQVDARVWGDVHLPVISIPPSTTVLFLGLATPLTTVSLLVVNGLVVPVAEERLWRGIIQPRLLVAWGVVPGLLVTAVLFSLKHAVVDASLGRLLALSVGGLALGVVALRASSNADGRGGWQTSTVSHAVANIAATSLALAAGLA